MMLNQAIFMNVADVYFEVIPAGGRLADFQSFMFPIAGMHNYAFHCRLGQMIGSLPSEADFNELLEITIEALPDGAQDIGVDVSVDDHKMMMVEVNVVRGTMIEPVGVFGPIAVN